MGYHAAVCKYGGFKTTRHSHLVLRLRTILRESGASELPREVEVLGWRRQDGTRPRLDVAFTAGGSREYVDVTVRHPGAAKYQERVARVDGQLLLWLSRPSV